jgi:hypothetical protein
VLVGLPADVARWAEPSNISGQVLKPPPKEPTGGGIIFSEGRNTATLPDGSVVKIKRPGQQPGQEKIATPPEGTPTLPGEIPTRTGQ